MGMKVTQPIEKPEALILYEQVTSFGLPLVSGGIMDQPHIWLQEYYVVYEEKTNRERLERERADAVARQNQMDLIKSLRGG